MPTPDETAFPPSPPIDIPARSLFASCPPEEDREAHASRDDSDHEGEDTLAAAEAQEIEGHTIAAIAAQEPTPEPEAHAHAAESPSESPSQAKEKERAVEHATTGQSAPSPLASPDTAAEGDAHAQASASSDAPASFPPQYLDFEPNKQRVRSCLADKSDIANSHASAIAELHIVIPSTRQQIQRHPTIRSPSIRCPGRDQRCRYGRVITVRLSPNSR